MTKPNSHECTSKCKPGEPNVAVSSSRQAKIARRSLLAAGSVTVAGLAAYPIVRRAARRRAPVFVARNQRYDGSLTRTIRDGLLATGLDGSKLPGKRVLLKPNLVEPTRDAPQMTTNPAVILAVAQVFRSWGASVLVGEGPGHVRDTEMALVESGVQEALDSEGLEFADLNYEEVRWVKNRGRASQLSGFFLPRSVADADLVVSLPKMKTHHWVGVTASLKNMYGVLPGIKYGWPKNVLHHSGIPQTVFDINASLPRMVTVVDGIECMEGDGPIMGTSKQMGLILVGTNPTAVDATVCRLMDLNPARITYLQIAADRLGPIDRQLIDQRGERWQPLAQRFQLLDRPHLRELRDGHLVS